ncbi:MAG: LysM peptidoglycan-binding domain-containing protein [Anaerolineales bacterium]|nr:LysM peptidoglycan-binding domain-containing protein [Anaerolineales bacterium]
MSETTEQIPTERRICPTCGSGLGPSATRCVVCGTSLHPEAGHRRTGSSAQITLSIPLAIALLAIFSLIAAGLTFAATRFMGSTPSEAPAETATITLTITSTLEPTPTETIIPSPTVLPTIEYTILEFDTCIGIAVRYDISVQSILQMNPSLTSQCILSVGQKINLPQPTPTASPEPTATLPPEEATRAACEKITYTVEANDTLSSIAQNYNVDQRGIMDYNGLTGETVFLGQVLIIPLCERLPTPGPSPTPTPPPPHPAPNLLLPQDGAAFTLANDTVTLQWASVGVLRENEVYEVMVEDITEGSGTRRILAYVTDTKYIVPTSFRPQESTPHVMRWSVNVVRQVGTTEAGDPLYESGGITSVNRDFTWSGAAIGPTPTP